MNSRLFRTGALAIVAFALGLVLARALLPARPRPPTTESATVLSEPRALPPVTLTRHDGRPFGNDYFADHYTLVFFGFTYCPDICPTTLAGLASVARSLADLRPPLRPQVLFVTVDPERDDVKQLSAYVTFFDPAFVGATGTAAQVASTAGAFSVPYAKVSDGHGGYTMDHGSSVFLVGPTGGIEALLTPPRDPALFARDYRAIVDYVERRR